MSDWIILRTSGRVTLKLVRTLCEDGIVAWAPSFIHRIRVPRFNVRREVTVALLPGWVFARATHLYDLLELARMDERPRRGAGGREPAHGKFSVFRDGDRIPAIADATLEDLRTSERRVLPARQRATFKPGDQVRAPSGSFEGMTGRVVMSRGNLTEVDFGGLIRVKISTFILLADVACEDEPAVRKAA